MSIKTHIEQHLNQSITSKRSISTGLFEAYQVRLNNGNQVFIKHQTNHNQQLIHEAQELVLLGKTINTPKVLGGCEFCLILEWIETVQNPKMQAKMGVSLAKLHTKTQTYFGFHIDNKIGTTPQINGVGKNISCWADFYWDYRLLYQIELAYQKKHLSKTEYYQLLQIKTHLPNLLNNDIKPALLHGDLWSGNVLSGKHSPYFIDSACYYGHREMDFALTFMFGGFSSDFYHSYTQIYPFEAGFEQRKPLYMLYHYLNHLNIFGSGYNEGVMRCYHDLGLS